MTPSRLPAPEPAISAEARPFWEAAAAGRLALPHCTRCDTVVWYPRAHCPECGGGVVWQEASGGGAVYSFTVIRRGGTGPYADASPYVVAYVELDEGPRVMTNIVDCDVDEVAIGDRVRVVFAPAGDGAALVRFRPA